MKILVNGTPWNPDRGAINVVGVTVTDDVVNLCTTLNFATQLVQLSPGSQQTGNINVSGSVQCTTGFGLNGAPVAQQNGTGNTHTVAAGSVTNVFTNTTFDGSTGSTAYTVGDIVKALKAFGLLAA